MRLNYFCYVVKHIIYVIFLTLNIYRYVQNYSNLGVLFKRIDIRINIHYKLSKKEGIFGSIYGKIANVFFYAMLPISY